LENIEMLNKKVWFNYAGILYEGKIIAKDGNYIKAQWGKRPICTVWLPIEGVRVAQ